MRPCPYCHAEIGDDIRKCEHCGFRVPPPHPPPNSLKTCPYCAERIIATAIKCRYCGSMLAQVIDPTPPAAVAVAGRTRQPSAAQDGHNRTGLNSSTTITVDPPRLKAAANGDAAVSRGNETEGGNKVVGATFGAGCGFVIGFSIFSLGLLLSLTGIGAIIGIPLMIAGGLFAFVLPLHGGLVGIFSRTGPCPYCGSLVGTGGKAAFDCPTCKQHVIVRGTKLFRVD